MTEHTMVCMNRDQLAFLAAQLAGPIMAAKPTLPDNQVATRAVSTARAILAEIDRAEAEQSATAGAA